MFGGGHALFVSTDQVPKIIGEVSSIASSCLHEITLCRGIYVCFKDTLEGSGVFLELNLFDFSKHLSEVVLLLKGFLRSFEDDFKVFEFLLLSPTEFFNLIVLVLISSPKGAIFLDDYLDY